MSIHDRFFEELLVLAEAIRAVRKCGEEDLTEQSLLALESANATVSTRALEVLDAAISDMMPTDPGPVAKVTPSTLTAEGNTSSQPSPSDLLPAAETPQALP